MSELVLSCRGLKKTYVQGKVEVPVLLGVDLPPAVEPPRLPVPLQYCRYLE